MLQAKDIYDPEAGALVGRPARFVGDDRTREAFATNAPDYLSTEL